MDVGVRGAEHRHGKSECPMFLYSAGGHVSSELAEKAKMTEQVPSHPELPAAAQCPLKTCL